MANAVYSPTRMGRFIHRLLIVSIALCSFGSDASAQTTVTLSTPGIHINADLTVQGGSSATVDFSDSPVLASKLSSESYTRRIMLKFDTQNHLPANAVIQSAHIYLVLRAAESSESRPLTAFHITRSFAKDQTNWLYYRTGRRWATRGGDLGPRFSTTYVGNAVGTAYKFDMTSMLQRTVNGEFGSRYLRVALLDTGAYDEGNYREFHSTRAASAALRPKLVVTYGTTASAPAPPSAPTVPAPAPVQTAAGETSVTLATPGTHINADTTIQGGAFGTTDFSSSPVLASKVSSESYTRRMLLKFDTQNFIPARAVIKSARLYLVLKAAESGERRPLTAYHVTRSFTRGQASWNYAKAGQPWSRRGGDLGPSFGTTTVGNAVGSTYSFDLTSMVQRAVNGDFGSRYTRLALVDTGAATDGNYREFHSTRASNPSLRPRLVITYATSGTRPAAPPSSPPPPTETSPPPPPPSTGTTLRVMQWNIHKTKGSDGRCNPDGIATFIAKHNPDVVSLNEVNFFSGVCAWSFDMSEKLESLLQQKTGVNWYRQSVVGEGGSSGTGNVLLSRHAPTSSGSTHLSYDRGVAQMSIVVNGRTINLFSTHVEYFTSWWRPIQIKQAVAWMRGFSEARIMLGDFNTWPNTSDYSIIGTPYQDAWTAAQNAGTATAYNGSGVTHGSSRFDYIFHSRVSVLSLQRVDVPKALVNGIYLSDHAPVIAVYRVN